MSERYVGKDAYEGKYGSSTVEWNSDQKRDESFSQMNVKNTETGDHYFTNTRTGVQGVALGDYRPGREK